MPGCPACGAPVDHAALQCAKCGATFTEPDLEFWESRLSPAQEAAVRTPGWFLPVLGILEIGGGAWGGLAVGMNATAGQFEGWLNGIVATALILLNVGAIWCGVMALQRRPGWLWTNSMLWMLQVVNVMSPLIAFSFSVGAYVTPYVSGPPFKLGINAWLGSSVQFHLLAPMPWGIGINLVALGVVLYLFKLQQRAARLPSS